MKMKRLHMPVHHLLTQAQEGNAQAQFELGIHPVLSREDQYYWLIKASQQQHSEALMELEKIQQEKELSRLFEAASNNNIEAQYKLGVHPMLDAEQHYNWLNRAASHGHNEARRVLHEMDMLLIYEGNKALVSEPIIPMEDVVH